MVSSRGGIAVGSGRSHRSEDTGLSDRERIHIADALESGGELAEW
jgi:hypothetical protein